jgi:hypothetical protein
MEEKKMQRKKYGPDLDKYLEDGGRKHVSYEQGARLYSMPYYSFVRLTKDAQANLRMRRSVVVDLDILEKYILKNHVE